VPVRGKRECVVTLELNRASVQSPLHHGASTQTKLCVRESRRACFKKSLMLKIKQNIYGIQILCMTKIVILLNDEKRHICSKCVSPEDEV